jgi:beta-fructofuranosidase
VTLRLNDRWVWDWWFAETDDAYHAFYLQAPRELRDPERRHANATIGHAVSTDLREWLILDDALGPSPTPAWDDVSTWTGSVIPHAGRWHMFYTGTTREGDALVQRVGLATSTDLATWQKHEANPVMEVDPRWYEDGDRDAWRETAWRDPWVFADPDGDGFHALITARRADGPAMNRGTIGHARSDDLVHWEVGPPVSQRSDFGHLEVVQSELVHGQHVLVFCCASDDIAPGRRERLPDETSGSFIAPGSSLVGPFDLEGARQVAIPQLYSARILRDRSDEWVIMGFRYGTRDEPFDGVLIDPVPLAEAMPELAVNRS